MREQIDAIERSMVPEAHIYASQERLEHVLHCLDIRAEAFLQLVADVAMQRAYVFIIQVLVGFAYEEHVGAPCEVLRPASTAAEANLARIEARARRWIGEGYKQLVSQRPAISEGRTTALQAVAAPEEEGTATVAPSNGRRQNYAESTLDPTRWEDIELIFTSEHRLQFRVGNETEVFNYGDLGMADGRNENPNLAWNILLQLAQGQGTVRKPVLDKTWPQIEKQIQAIRKFLRRHFNLPGDPVPFVEGEGYRARFTIRRHTAYRT